MLKIVLKNLWAIRAPPRTLLGAHSAPRPPSWWGLLPPPQEPHPAFGLRPPFSALSQQSSFPQCVFVRVLIKTLVVPIFGAKECIRIQDFVLNIQKKSGVATPGPPRREGRHLFVPTPVPTRQMMVPLRFFWAGYGPVWAYHVPFP